MINIRLLARTIHCKALEQYDQEDTFSSRDEIKAILSGHLLLQPSAYWLQQLHEKDLWAMEVFDWEKLTSHEAYHCLQMEQVIRGTNGNEIITTRCPIRINGQKLFSSKPAPALGAHNLVILHEFLKPAN
jgi:crotonobetainyl-CoA:carnitine CoA-transferase CaiB-like acyl-CoA transferase